MKRPRAADWLICIAAVVALVWWRGHTFGPSIAESIGLKLWPVVEGASEPLDCDESAYGYMGRRMADGAVLYKDLTEYKPPGGYWFYGLAVGIGGASEMTVRLMILPVLICNLWLVGAVSRRISNRAGAVVAMGVFILMSTDPYVFGNGSNLEHLMNLGLTAAVWAFLKSDERLAVQDRTPGQGFRIIWLMASGVFVGLAATVKQVALLGMIPIMAAILTTSSATITKVRQFSSASLGFLLPWLVVGAILAVQGALPDAVEDVVNYSRALAADTPPDANAPPLAYRWLTGNSDPRNGRLPWPFGRTDWLVWWGTGAWPLHSVTALIVFGSLALGSFRSHPELRFILWQWPLAWAMIALPGLFWQHYYMLLGPPSAMIVGAAFGNALTRFRNADSNRVRAGAFAVGVLVVVATSATLRIQISDYLMVSSQQLTVKYKGGAQWVTLRDMGGELKVRTAGWEPKPLLEVWGWQSPLLYYSGLDAPGRYFFTDPLAKSEAGRKHHLVSPRLRELAEELRSKRPELIFCGDVPFAEMKAMLDRDYITSSLVGSTPDGRGLFVRKDRYQAFHGSR